MMEADETYRIAIMNTALPFNVKAGPPITIYKDNNSLCKCSKMYMYVGTCVCILYIHTYLMVYNFLCVAFYYKATIWENWNIEFTFAVLKSTAKVSL